MNPASKSSLPVVLDPVVAAIIAQLKQETEQALAAKDRIIAMSALKIQKLEEALRLERVKKYGKQSEKLSDLQLQLLDLEPGVSSDEVQSEIERGPLPASNQESDKPTDKQQIGRRNHPGRNELPARAVHMRQVRRRDQGHRLRSVGSARHEAGGVLCDAHPARKARLRAVHRAGCGNRAGAGAHRAQVDLLR
jgi:hypothetical protein